MQRWRPDRNRAFLLAGLTALCVWSTGSVTGAHPDGAILGFAGMMFTVYATQDRSDRRRQERKKRKKHPSRPQVYDQGNEVDDIERKDETR